MLRLKATLLKAIIDKNQDDPRVFEPKRQLKIIEDELNFREHENANEDSGELVVGLRTLELRGSSKLRR